MCDTKQQARTVTANNNQYNYYSLRSASGDGTTQRAHLAAPNAATALAALLELFAEQLAQIGDHVARLNVLARNVANDAIQANPRMHAALDVQNHLKQRIVALAHALHGAVGGGALHHARAQRVAVGLVLARFVPLLDARPRRRFARIDFPLVRLQIGAVEHVVKHCNVGRRRRARQVGHQVHVDLEARVFEQLERAHCVRRCAAAVDLAQNFVVCVLHTELHTRHAKASQPPQFFAPNLGFRTMKNIRKNFIMKNITHKKEKHKKQQAERR